MVLQEGTLSLWHSGVTALLRVGCQHPEGPVSCWQRSCESHGLQARGWPCSRRGARAVVTCTVVAVCPVWCLRLCVHGVCRMEGHGASEEDGTLWRRLGQGEQGAELCGLEAFPQDCLQQQGW